MRKAQKNRRPDRVKLTAIVQRHHLAMPRFLEIPSKKLAKWRLSGTIVVEGTINRVELGRRSLKHWNKECWFIDLPNDLCLKTQIDTGSKASVVLRIAPDNLPEELSQLIDDDPAARDCWRKLTPSQQRTLREHVLSAKRPNTRQKRSAKALLGSE
ncbi:YdeI/OmpD-associated family protein [bacterium]|nr:YdeI/OmpD-associated family protein [bacterium]